MIRKLIYASLISVFLLAGCQQATKPTPPPQQLDHVQVDPSLLQVCPKLPSFDITKPVPLADLYTAYSNLQGQYATCATRLLCLIEVELGKPGTCPIGKSPPVPPNTPKSTGSTNASREQPKP